MIWLIGLISNVLFLQFPKVLQIHYEYFNSEKLKYLMLTYAVNSWKLVKLCKCNKSRLVSTYLHLGTPYHLWQSLCWYILHCSLRVRVLEIRRRFLFLIEFLTKTKLELDIFLKNECSHWCTLLCNQFLY